jgi:photosystem II stability/assembly factor-like uncharacterized protein
MHFLLKILHTTDGGRTWKNIGSMVPTNQALMYINSVVQFSDPFTGWLEVEAPGEGTKLYMTRDSGKTWTPVTLPSSTNLIQLPQRPLPQFFDSRDGVSVVIYADKDLWYRYASYVTHDGGRTWTGPAPTANNVRTPPGGARWSFLDMNHWWFCGGASGGHIAPFYVTSDSGQHWSVLPQHDLAGVEQFGFISQKIGWAIASSRAAPDAYHLYETTNGGSTWSRVKYTVAI